MQDSRRYPASAFTLLFLVGTWIAIPVLSRAQATSTESASSNNQNNQPSAPVVAHILSPVLVTALDFARPEIDTASGASSYMLDQSDINTMYQGEDSSFNRILARTPGVSSDTYGAIHFREEDPYYRYYRSG